MNKMQRLLSKSLSIIIALSLIISLTGCYQIEKIINKGTVKGVSLCIEHNTSSLLSEEIVKRKCIKDNQARLKYKHLDSSASLYIGSITNEYGGNIELARGTNTYDDYVITEIHVNIDVYDADGNKQTLSEVIETWVEPSRGLVGSSTIKKFDLPNNTTSENINKEYCSETLKKTCRDWYINHINGVKI